LTTTFTRRFFGKPSMSPSCVGAVGVPDAKSGEAVKIVVVKKNQDLAAEELISHCGKYCGAPFVNSSVRHAISV
jgi:acyl-CoA synthetase (AMP-forming)/AMP-acid ligase II